MNRTQVPHNPRVTGLRVRFALAMLLWVAAGLLLVGVSASALFRRHVERTFHAELQEHLIELVGLVDANKAGQPHLTRPLSDPRYGTAGSGYYWQVNRNAAPLLRSPSLAGRRLEDRAARADGITHIRAAGPSGQAMIYGTTQSHRDPARELTFLIATDVRHLDRLVADFRRDLLMWLSALAGLLVAGALLALRYATRPLDALASAIARVRDGTERRMGQPWPAELAPLTADLDRLLDNREAMVTAARIEAGNLAHALRTSLAILTDEAENLADQPAGTTLLAECRRMARQLDWHLARARAAAGQGVIIETPLPGALMPLIMAMQRLHAARGICFAVDGAPARLAIDPEAFAEILSNLLDNAGKWARSSVEVRWRETGDKVVIEVTDDGPGIPAGQVERLWAPGARLDEQTPGHGLGLAIARDLVTAAKGDLQLSARADGLPGTTAILMLATA